MEPTSSTQSSESNNSTLKVNVLHQPVGIIGAGVTGLIHAHVLLQDGFTDITLITRDASIGGTWARQRVYPGLHLNNVHGEYRFSALEMPPPENSAESGGRLSGLDICNYMEAYTEKFLAGRVQFRFETEVLGVDRAKVGQWQVRVRHKDPGGGGEQVEETLGFSRIVLATGGLSVPSISHSLSREAAQQAGYQGLVIHMSEFGPRLQDILSITRPKDGESGEDSDTILVIGGGKSAQDACKLLTNQGRKTAMVFEKPRGFVAVAKPVPEFLRKNRMAGVLSGHPTLTTGPERFFHTTSLGAWLVKKFWSGVGDSSCSATNVQKDSPLYPKEYGLFWSMALGDEGVVHPGGFYPLATSGAIRIISPARALGYDDQSVTLSNGELISPKVVILATGYQCSWPGIISDSLSKDLGMDRQPWSTDWSTEWPKKWNYSTFRDRPDVKDESGGFYPIHRGIVPIKNLENRDFAIAGALYSASTSYINEVAAHWVSSYFRGDPMRLPKSIEEATSLAEERGAWSVVRYPGALKSFYGSLSATALHYSNFPQFADELLEDMYLPSMRSGRGWFSWLFNSVDSRELSTVAEERRLKREVAKAS